MRARFSKIIKTRNRKVNFKYYVNVVSIQNKNIIYNDNSQVTAHEADKTGFHLESYAYDP